MATTISVIAMTLLFVTGIAGFIMAIYSIKKSLEKMKEMKGVLL